MELNLFSLAPLLQCTSIDRCALFMRAKKKNYFILSVIKIIPLAHFFFILLFVPLSLSFTLISIHSLNFGLSIHSLNSHRSSTSPTHQPSQAVNQPQTNTAIRLRPMLSIASDPLLSLSLSL